MSFTQSFKLAIKSLRTSKARAILTMLGIIIGVAAVIVIISLGNGLTGMVEQQVEKVGINQIYAYNWGFGGGALALDAQEIYDLVEERPDVFAGVTPWVSAGTGTRKGSEKYEKTGIYGVSEVFYNPELSATLDGDQLAKGRFLSYVDVLQRSNVCVIGAYLEENAFGGDALGQGLIVGGVPYTVIGVMKQGSEVMEEGGGDDMVYIPYENALQLSGTRQVQLFQLTCTSRETSGLAKELLTELMLDFYGEQYSDNGQTFYIQTMAEQVAMINGMMGVAMAVLVAIAAISLLVGGIGIMNIMLVSVTERTREIGVRKSLGAKRKDIRSQFVIEAGTTSAIGGLLGIGFGWLLAKGIGAVLGGMLSENMGGGVFDATPTMGAILLSFSVSVGIGVLFGYLPANKAAKLNPIDALRYD